ncbi:MAG: oligosaccharide flippase family protein [Planctomycetes bacterium]|nr:oligosaccharide flippase family protein [Planctomycetota bacterium]
MILRNVLSNWAGHFVFMLAGFVLPRVIGDRAGAETLGLWDFGWSLVSYTVFLSMDIGGAVNRYVARYRALADWDSLNVAVNSCLAILSVAFVLALAAALCFAALVPVLLPSMAAAALTEARWMVLILGINAAIQLPLSILNGVISGCERFDLKNAVRIGVHVAQVTGMIVVLLLGYRLVALAGLVLAGTLVREGLNYVVAKRVCPQFRIAPRLSSWPVAREMLSFGGKSALQSVSRSGMYHTSGILVAYFLGPAALAVYARQRALVLHASRFLSQYAHVFIPASSALHAAGDESELRALFLKSTKYALYIALPIVALLVIMGGPLVRLWMGPDYQAPLVLAVLAIGHLVPLAQRPAFCILIGMDRHGIPALAEALAAAASIGLGILFIGVFAWGLLGAALAIALPMTVGAGVAVLVSACRVFKVPIVGYARRIVPGPVAAVVPFALVLAAARWLCEDAPLVGLAIGPAGGGLLLAGVYWRWVLPESLKRRIRRLSPRRAPRVPAARQQIGLWPIPSRRPSSSDNRHA